MGVAGMRWNPSRCLVGGAVLDDFRAADMDAASSATPPSLRSRRFASSVILRYYDSASRKSSSPGAILFVSYCGKWAMGDGRWTAAGAEDTLEPRER
mmetsp:Transcript_52222/g.156747  ORF Transcript_52222/g.156747 Transcript_52222/m.156747 type:complete len:97 (+) Transcript_52222:172-462(+)